MKNLKKFFLSLTGQNETVEDTPKEKEPVKIYIPEHAIEEVLRLGDATFADKKSYGSNDVAKYRLWKYIGELIPEIKEGQWVLNSGNILKPYVISRDKDDE